MKRKKRKNGKRILSLVMAMLLILTLNGNVIFAASSGSWSFTVPEKALSTATGTDGKRNVTMNAFRASIPTAALLGADLVAGGNITWQTQDADGNTIGFNLIGSDVNVNPDTYVWNFLYMSRFFHYKNQVRTFAWLNEKNEEVSSEEVYKVLPQSEFLFPILTYDSNTHNMYASWGGNDTDTGSMPEFGGVSKTLSMRPDLITGNDGTSYADQIETIRSWREGDPYYQKGDESYNPTFVETGVGTIDQKIDGVKIVAGAINDVIDKSGNTLTTRYGDPEVIANDYEKAIYGIYYYVMSNLEKYGGTIKEKNVARVTAYNADDNTYTVSTTFAPSLQLLGTHTTNKVFDKVTAVGSEKGEVCEFKLSASDLAKFDYIRAESLAIKSQLFADFEKLGLKKDQVPDVEEKTIIGVCNTATEWACNVITQEFPITQIYAYRDELAAIDPAINPVAMVSYIAENWYHVSSAGNTLENVTAKMLDNYWNPVSELDNVPDKSDYVYDKAKLEDAMKQGIAFAKAHASDTSTWLDGSFNINDPIYKALIDGEEYSSDRVSLTDDIKNAYLEGMKAHPWNPDLTAGIGSDGLPPVDDNTDYAQKAADQFKDVEKDDWFAENVGKAVARGLFRGVADDEFAPGSTMNRAMAVTVLYRMNGSPAVSGTTSFTDVKADDYFANAVKWAVDQKVTNGKSETQFDPTGSLTRQEFVTFLYRYTDATGGDIRQNTDLGGWDDHAQLDSWARIPMQWAVQKGVIKGKTSTTLAPKDTTTRAEVATMLVRFS